MPVHNRLLLALAVVFLLAGLLLAAAARGAGPLPGDLAVSNWLQQLAPAGSIVGTVLRRASTTGSISVAMLLVVLLIRGQRRVGLFSLAGGIGALALGELLIKEIVARPRPNTDVLSVAQLEYGFPSTTTMTGVVVLGLLCYFVSRGQAREQPSRRDLIGLIVFSILLLLIGGLGRVYVGLHWISDILGAYLFGLALLLLLILVWKRLKVEGSSPKVEPSTFNL